MPFRRAVADGVEVTMTAYIIVGSGDWEWVWRGGQ